MRLAAARQPAQYIKRGELDGAGGRGLTGGSASCDLLTMQFFQPSSKQSFTGRIYPSFTRLSARNTTPTPSMAGAFEDSIRVGAGLIGR